MTKQKGADKTGHKGSWNSVFASEYVDKYKGSIATGAETLALAGLLQYKLPGFLTSVREAGYHMDDALSTISDFTRGGPEGYRAGKRLEDALQVVKAARDKNQEAGELLDKYTESREGFTKSLIDVYQQNENVSQVAGRLEVQLKGAMKNMFDAGNELKPESFKRTIDDTIIVTYGKTLGLVGVDGYSDLSRDQILAKSLESSDKLKQFYTEARKFYDARAKNENTIQNFCDYLATVQTTSESQNQLIEEAFPKLITALKEQYKLEDRIITQDEKCAGMTTDSVNGLGQTVKGFGETVSETRSETGRGVPMPKYNEGSWVDIVTNPLALAIAGVSAYKGLTRGYLGPIGSKVDDAISYVITRPLALADNGVKYIAGKLGPANDDIKTEAKE